MKTRSAFHPLALAMLLAAAGGAAGAVPTERATFAMISKADTVMFDDFTRTSETIEGRMTVGGSPRQDYTMTLGAGATVRRTHVGVFKREGNGKQPRMYLSITADHEGDSVVVGHRDRKRTVVHRTELPPGGMLGVIGSAAFLEQVIRRARALGSDSLGLVVFLPENGETWETTVSDLGPDSTRLLLSGEEWRLATDAEGRILGGSSVTSAMELRRLPYRRH